jgi:hypothetical protein
MEIPGHFSFSDDLTLAAALERDEKQFSVLPSKNGSNQRRQTTLNSAPAALVRPLHLNC